MASSPAAVAAVTEILFLHIQRLLARFNSVCGGILLALRQVEPGEQDGVLRVPVQLHVLRGIGRAVKEPVHGLLLAIIQGDLLHAAVVEKLVGGNLSQTVVAIATNTKT